MRDYWLTQDLLQAVTYGFLALSLLGIALALWLPKKWWHKGLALALVLFLISIPLRQGRQAAEQQQQVVNEYKQGHKKGAWLELRGLADQSRSSRLRHYYFNT